MLNTEKVVGVLKAAGLVAEKTDGDYTRCGFRVRKINKNTVGIIFDSLGYTGPAHSLTAKNALQEAGFSVMVQPDNQTLVVKNA